MTVSVELCCARHTSHFHISNFLILSWPSQKTVYGRKEKAEVNLYNIISKTFITFIILKPIMCLLLVSKKILL